MLDVARISFFNAEFFSKFLKKGMPVLTVANNVGIVHDLHDLLILTVQTSRFLLLLLSVLSSSASSFFSQVVTFFSQVVVLKGGLLSRKYIHRKPSIFPKPTTGELCVQSPLLVLNCSSMNLSQLVVSKGGLTGRQYI